jgi:hypothetical protein
VTKPIKKRLDRNRKYSTFHPPHNGAVAFQDGRYFNTADVEILMDAHGRPIEVDADIEDEHIATAKTVDLRKWVNGTAAYPFNIVSDALDAQFSIRLGSPEAAAEFLRERGY